MRKLPILLLVGYLMSLAMLPAAAQTLENTSPAQLRHLVQQGRADTIQVQALIWLSDFYLFKEEASSQDKDSARILAQQATDLSQRLGYAHGRDWAIFKTGQYYVQQHATKLVLRVSNSLSDTSRIKLLLDLAQTRFDESVDQNTRPDSAWLFFRQAAKLSVALGQPAWQEKSLFQLGTAYLRLDDLPRGRACFQQVISANQRAGNNAGEMKAWYQMGIGYAYDERFQPKYFAEMRACFKPALALARQTHNRKYEGLVRMQLAIMEYYEGQLAEAEAEMLQALAIMKAVGYKPMYYYIYSYLANVSQDRGNLAGSLVYILQTIKSLKDVGKMTDLDYPYYKLASNYYASGQMEKAIDALNKSLAASHQRGEIATRAALGPIINLMVSALLHQGKANQALLFVQDMSRRKTYADLRDIGSINAAFGDCYVALKQYKLAEQYYNKGLYASKKANCDCSKGANLDLAHLYVMTGQYGKAEPYLKYVSAAAPGQVPLLQLQEMHLLSFQVDSALGHYLPAIAHLRKRQAIKDSLYSVTQSRQLEALQVQFETKEKEQNIQLLTEKGLRQQNELQRAQTTRNATIGGSFMLLLLLGLGYNRYRLKQRTNVQLEAQKREINEKNHSLEVVLSEKEWLLKEIHHRVKNNLQIIISLLQSQSKYLLDEAAINAIEQSQHRVRAMALIHQKLYRSESLSRIDMPAYIREVVEHLSECFDPEEQIRFRFQLAPLELDVAQAVPLGLIINEAITNALKYAFPPNFRPAGDGGIIDLTLAEVDAEHYLLMVADDGVGIPADVDLRRSNSMGANIMRGLSKQLGGDLHVANGHGVTISVPFTLVHLQPQYAEAS